MLNGLVLSVMVAVGSVALLGASASGADSVTLRVVDRSGRTSTEPVILASSLNGWDPSDKAWAFKPVKSVDGENGRAWELEVPLSKLPAAGGVECKFAVGDWKAVEVSAKGGDVGNRVLEVKTLREAAGGTVDLLPILGFADQRGTRWPELTAANAPLKSTVVGDLDIFTMHSSILDNDRKVRVWLPPGYKDPANKDKRYAVLYMHDGQNCFDVVGSFAGVEWGCDETATALIKAGTIEPLIIVGIDNTGHRAEEYNPPYTGYDGKKNYGDKYLKFVTDEVMPRINKEYRTLTDREHTGIGGSSFGGNATLYAVMERPDLFGRAIVESAAVFLDDKAIVKKARENDKWPIRMFIAVGTAEGARSGDAAAFANLNKELMAALREKGLGEDRLKTEVAEGAVHNEGAWAKRFPDALGFVFGK